MRSQAPFDIIGVVEPGIIATKNALNNSDSKVLVLGTNATITSKAYETLLEAHGFNNVIAKATGLFVPIIEEGLFEGEVLNSTIEHYFKDLEHPDGIILGCTHFPLIADAISEYFDDNVTLIHSGEAIVEYLESHYEFKEKHPDPKIKFFASENPEALRKTAQKWLNLPLSSV